MTAGTPPAHSHNKQCNTISKANPAIYFFWPALGNLKKSMLCITNKPTYHKFQKFNPMTMI